jgi:hypothetical protein
MWTVMRLGGTTGAEEVTREDDDDDDDGAVEASWLVVAVIEWEDALVFVLWPATGEAKTRCSCRSASRTNRSDMREKRNSTAAARESSLCDVASTV